MLHFQKGLHHQNQSNADPPRNICHRPASGSFQQLQHVWLWQRAHMSKPPEMASWFQHTFGITLAPTTTSPVLHPSFEPPGQISRLNRHRHRHRETGPTNRMRECPSMIRTIFSLTWSLLKPSRTPPATDDDARSISSLMARSRFHIYPSVPFRQAVRAQ